MSLSQESAIFVRHVLALIGESEDLRSQSSGELLTLSAAASITPREQEVLHHVSEGLLNREIATQFSTSESTIKTHLRNIYRKLDMHTRTRAAAQARVLKLVYADQHTCDMMER